MESCPKWSTWPRNARICIELNIHKVPWWRKVVWTLIGIMGIMDSVLFCRRRFNKDKYHSIIDIWRQVMRLQDMRIQELEMEVTLTCCQKFTKTRSTPTFIALTLTGTLPRIQEESPNFPIQNNWSSIPTLTHKDTA